MRGGRFEAMSYTSGSYEVKKGGKRCGRLRQETAWDEVNVGSEVGDVSSSGLAKAR